MASPRTARVLSRWFYPAYRSYQLAAFTRPRYPCHHTRFSKSVSSCRSCNKCCKRHMQRTPISIECVNVCPSIAHLNKKERQEAPVAHRSWHARTHMHAGPQIQGCAGLSTLGVFHLSTLSRHAKGDCVCEQEACKKARVLTQPLSHRCRVSQPFPWHKGANVGALMKGVGRVHFAAVSTVLDRPHNGHQQSTIDMLRHPNSNKSESMLLACGMISSPHPHFVHQLIITIVITILIFPLSITLLLYFNGLQHITHPNHGCRLSND